MTLEPIKIPDIMPYNERVKLCKSDALQHFTNRNEIYKAVDRERYYQDNKHGTLENHPHSVGEWLLIMEDELQEAKNGWCREHSDSRALEEILQVIATGVACLEQHGIVERKSNNENTTKSLLNEVMDPKFKTMDIPEVTPDP